MSEFQELHIGDHISLLSGFPFSSDRFNQNEGTRLIRIRDLLESDGDKTYYRGLFDSTWLVKPKDILIGMDGDFNIVRWQGDEALLNQRILKVEAKPNGLIDQDYFFYWCGPYLSQVHSRTAATTVKHLSTKDIAKAKALFPSNKQQQRIAEILQTVDLAIEETEALVKKWQKINAGFMQDLFARGVTPSGKLRPSRRDAPESYRETPHGWIPKDWKVSCCADEFTIDSGITLGPHRRPNKSPYPYLRVANVFRDRINLDEVTRLEATLEEARQKALKTYDLLVVEGHANRNEIGRCAMVYNNAEGMLFQNHLFRLRAIRLDPCYSLLWLNSSHAQHYWESKCATSSGLNTINRKLLGAMPVLVPTSQEQTRIVEAIFSYREMEGAHISSVAKLRAQKQGLMQTLLTGRVRVKIGHT